MSPANEASCILCGSSGGKTLFRATDRLYRTTDKSFDLVECAGCGLIRLSPRPTLAEAAAYYPGNYWFDPAQSTAGRLEELYRRWVLRDHVRFVMRALQDLEAGGLILDIGCGGGLFPGMLREHGHRAMGLDLSPQATALAWKVHGVPAVAGELSRSPIAPNTCAAVTMFHVLEHLNHPECYLREAHRLLQPGGRLIVQVPNAASWQFALLGAAWNGVDTPRHIHLFRDSDLEKLLMKCGYTPLRRKYFSWRDNPAGLATSLAPSLDPMARRVRGAGESPGARLAKDLLYFTLVVASVPIAAADAMVQAGSTIMIEAQKAA
jgi:SAM-dependent methyltransferase